MSSQDPESPAPVSGTWAVSTTRLTQDAGHLFNLCAFFSPEPIAVKLSYRTHRATTEPPGLA